MDNNPAQPTTTPPAQSAPTVSPSTSSPEQPKVKSSSKLPWIIVAILLIALAGLGGYMIWGNSNSSLSKTSIEAEPTSEEVEETPTPTVAALETYTSTQLPGTSFKAYTIMYPTDFVKDVKRDDVRDTLTLSKGENKIVIYQAAFGGGPCDAPKFVEIDSGIGVLRRIETDSSQVKPGISTFSFCGSSDGTTYGLPTTVGSISYELPQGYSPDILKDMDAVIKTLTSIK